MVAQHIGAMALIVPEYDAALDFYIETLGFDLIRDEDQGNGKRWVMVAPRGSAETRILLAKAADAAQTAAIGNQTGGRVFLLLNTDDFDRDYQQMVARGVIFEEAPRTETYGKVAIWRDPFGNRWDLLQLS